jgi:AcrR family transcriptional regulator
MRTSKPRRVKPAKGTPASPKGRARAAQILEAAREVLVEAGYTQFSLRNIAAAAGIHLSNLQYYFPTRAAVIKALLDYVVQDYNAHYEERFRNLPPDPEARFTATIAYLVEDIGNPETRRFFIQLWALLESSDPSGVGKLLNKLYAPHIENLAQHVSALNPGLSRASRQQRAAMIAAMIDGMMLMLGDADLHTRPGQPRIAAIMRQEILRIATAPEEKPPAPGKRRKKK